MKITLEPIPDENEEKKQKAGRGILSVPEGSTFREELKESAPEVKEQLEEPKIKLEPVSLEEQREFEGNLIEKHAMEWFDEEKKRHSDLIQAYKQTVAVDPEATAKNMYLSSMTGMPQWMLEEDPEVRLEAEKNLPPESLMRIAKEAPMTAAFFSDPNMMAIGKDDLENASMLELAIEGWSKGWEQSKVFREISNVLTKEGLTAESLQKVYELAQDLPMDQRGLSVWQRAIYGAGEFGAQSARALGRGLQRGGWAAVAATIMTALFPPIAPLGIPIATGAIGAAFGAGMASGSFEEVFSQEFGAAFLEYIDAGLDPQEAFAAAFVVGAVNGGIEMAQIGTLMNAFPGGRQLISKLTGSEAKKLLAKKSFRSALAKLAKNMGLTGITETGQEVAQENVNLIVRELARRATGDEDVKPASFEESLQRSWEIVKDFGPAALLFGFLGAGSTVTTDMWGAYKATKTQAMLKDVSKGAKESKLLKRAPAKFKRLVRSVGENAGVKSIYIPVEAFNDYFQGAGQTEEGAVVTPVEVAEELGIRESYDEAVATGGKVEIPIDVAIEKLAPTEHFDNLIDDMAVNEEDMTVNEARQELARFEEKVKQEWKTAQEEVLADTEERRSAEQVKEIVKTQLVAAGMGAREADVSATLVMARSLAAAKTLGITPEQWLNRIGLKITGEASEITEQTAKPRRFAMEAEADRFDPGDFGTIEQETEAGLEERTLIPEEEAMSEREEIRALEKEQEEVRKRVLKIIKDNGGLDYQSIVNTFGKEEAKQLRKEIGAKMFTKEGGMSLDEAAQLMDGIVNIENDNEMWQFLKGEVVKRYEQTAFHGSPYKFDKFSLEHIGTGEGAQSYGWGLYFAGKKEVADWYREILASPQEPLILQGKPLDSMYVDDLREGWPELYEGLSEEDQEHMDEVLGQLATVFTLADAEQAIDYLSDESKELYRDRVAPYLEEVARDDTGQLYEVEIPDDDVLLYWDKPLSEQSEHVRSVIESIELPPEFTPHFLEWIAREYPSLTDDIYTLTPSQRNKIIEDYVQSTGEPAPAPYKLETGKDFYYALVAKTGSQKAASEYLNSLGIKGIKYLDKASRDKGEGSYNYVIFDDNAIKTLKTYYQTAYHGSPYRFDEFTLEHIGSGEGVQAFGWGLYFAGNKQIAEYYRQKLQGAEPLFRVGDGVFQYTDQGWMWNDDPNDPNGWKIVTNELDEDVLDVLRGYEFDKEKALQDINKVIDDPDVETDTVVDSFEIDRLHEIKAYLEEVEVEELEPGQLYEVEIPNDTGENYIDWDNPVPETTKKRIAEQAVEEGYGDYSLAYINEEGVPTLNTSNEITGEGLYKELTRVLGSQEEASRFLNRAGFVGIKYLDATSRHKGEGTHNYVIFDDEAIGILDTYYQKTGQSLGKISIGKGTAIINLGKKADLSTFLHELGHLFLEDMSTIASQKDAPDWVKQDYKTILKWLGAEEGKPLTREQHEQFARGFEAYLMEGKAPSSALRKAFETFKRWLTKIYVRITNLDVELNDEVREVMDRLLATEDEIAEAEARNGYEAFLAAIGETAIPDDVVAEYQEEADKAHEEAWRSLFKKALKTTTKAWKELKKQRIKQARKEAEEEVKNMPVYRAIEEMSKPVKEGMRLNYDATYLAYGEEFLQKIPKKILAKTGRFSADMVAEYFGYNSGEEMLLDIINAPTKQQKIKELTEAKVREFNVLIEGGNMAEQAEEAIRNPSRIDVIIAEINILKQIAAGTEKENIKLNKQEAIRRKEAVKLAVESAVSAMHPNKLSVRRYLRLEQKAIKKAFEAIAKGDFESAAYYKEQQLVNHQMAITMLNEKAEVDRMIKRLRQYENKPPKLPVDYLDQLDAIFARVSMKRITNKDLNKMKRLADWIKEQEDESLVVAIPEKLRNEAFKKNVKDMTVQEIRDLYNAVQNIVHLGRLKNKLLSRKEIRERNAVVNELVASKEKVIGNKKKPKKPMHPTRWQKAKELIASFGAHHLKVEFLCKVLDDFKDTGPWQEYIHQAFVDASQNESLLKEEAYKRLQEIFSVYSDEEWRDLRTRRRHFASVGHDLTKEDVLTLALNMGAKQNRERVLNPKGGWGWTEEQVWDILDILDERDWQVVQDIWDFLDSYWPMIERLHIETAGVRPTKKEAVPVETKYGTLRGGYYPIAYDSRQHFRARQLTDKQLHEDFNQGYYAFGHTSQGHLKEAAESTGLPLKLGFGVLNQHLENMLHDLAFRKAVIDVGKILRDDRVREAITDAFGQEGYAQFVSWHKAVASTRRDLFDPFAAILKKARYGATIVTMGFKASVVVAQFLGYFTSAHVVGTGRMVSSLVEFMANPKGMWDDVLSRSDFMRHRQEGFDRDAKDALDKMIGRDGKIRKVNVAALHAIGFADMMVSVPTWHAAYMKALNEGISGEKAVAYADSIVRKSQGAGHTYSLSAIQRGDKFGEFQKLFTMYYSFFNVLYNLMYSEVKYAQLKGIKPMKVATAAFYLVIAPALLGELMTMRGPDEDENPWIWALLEMLGYVSSSVVGLRDITSYGLLGYSYRFTPAAEALKSMGSLLKNVKDVALDWDDEDEWIDLAKSAYEAGGYWLPYPSRQIQITTEGLWDWWAEDPDFKVQDLLFWRKK